MDLGDIGVGMRVVLERMPAGPLTNRLYQFGLVEGTEIYCVLARRRIIAIQWGGTVVALRRKNLGGIQGRVVA